MRIPFPKSGKPLPSSNVFLDNPLTIDRDKFRRKGVRTCLIVPYSGALPNWMPLFLRSVELNPDVHLFLLSTRTPDWLPANVTLVPLSLSEIEGRVRKYIDAALSVDHAYKLCALKPFYGLLFPELVEGYDFWGYCDIDLVFGNLSELLTADRLALVDVFFADAHMVVGHFALYRNHPEINALAKRIPNYIKRIAIKGHCALDEDGMTEVVAANPGIRWSKARTLRESQLTLTANGQMMGRTFGVLGDQHRGYWRAGRSYIESREHSPQEVLYLHFMGLKRSYHWKYYDPTRTYEEFSFSAAGFLPWICAPDRWSELKTAIRGGALLALSSLRGMVAQAMPDDMRFRAKEILRRRAS
jgi:hypothetical protein